MKTVCRQETETGCILSSVCSPSQDGLKTLLQQRHKSPRIRSTCGPNDLGPLRLDLGESDVSLLPCCGHYVVTEHGASSMSTEFEILSQLTWQHDWPDQIYFANKCQVCLAFWCKSGFFLVFETVIVRCLYSRNWRWLYRKRYSVDLGFLTVST